MAVITLGQARKLLAPYAGKSGKCPETEDARLFVMEVIQRLLHQGANGNLRKWCFITDNGCFTAPHDLDVPVKITIDGYPDNVWSKWFEFYETAPFADANCSQTVAQGIREEVNPYCTVYDLPCEGARIYTLALSEEADDAHLLIQGIDINGRDVYVEHMGEKIHGEYLEINKQYPKRTKTIFKKIISVQKTKTNNYIRLYWQSSNKTGLLAEYRPEETHPQFRRFKVPQIKPNCCAKITVLGRVKDPDYHHDNDILPITNISALRKMAQVVQAEDTNKIDVANYKRELTMNLLDDENQYKRNGEEPFDFIFETSPGNNYNMI